jgi:cytochrome c oxidase cbb3-type subunit 3
MSVEERDEHTGHLTTGHEWNGIKELNKPVARIVWISYIVAFLIAAPMLVLWPAFPLGTTFTPGLLGVDQRKTLDRELSAARLKRQPWQEQIQNSSVTQLNGDAQLMTVVRQAGRTLFMDNCAVCHGTDAKGRNGYPNLTDKAWLWGKTPEAIMETLRVGINSANDDSRASEMPAFGRDELLEPAQVAPMVAYVQRLSAGTTSEASEEEKTVFADNCASCHGPNGKGDKNFGAPNLTDANWIYGKDKKTLHQTIWNGRKGHMPHWEGRLSKLDRKILMVYLLDLPKTPMRRP